MEGGKAPSIPCPFWSELHSMGIAGNKLYTEEIAGTVSFAGLHTGMQVRGTLLTRAPLHLYKGQCEGLWVCSYLKTLILNNIEEPKNAKKLDEHPSRLIFLSPFTCSCN